MRWKTEGFRRRNVRKKRLRNGKKAQRRANRKAVNAKGKAKASGASTVQETDAEDEEWVESEESDSDAADDAQLPKDIKDVVTSAVIVALRELQRCLDTESDPFTAARAKFAGAVRNTCREHGQAGEAEKIIKYFDKYWFNDTWRGALSYIISRSQNTDITIADTIIDGGLPQGRARTAFLNTNNHIESMFRTLQVVFLEFRKNKRY
jgi:hypothetical protein